MLYNSEIIREIAEKIDYSSPKCANCLEKFFENINNLSEIENVYTLKKLTKLSTLMVLSHDFKTEFYKKLDSFYQSGIEFVEHKLEDIDENYRDLYGEINYEKAENDKKMLSHMYLHLGTIKENGFLNHNIFSLTEAEETFDKAKKHITNFSDLSMYYTHKGDLYRNCSRFNNKESYLHNAFLEYKNSLKIAKKNSMQEEKTFDKIEEILYEFPQFFNNNIEKRELINLCRRGHKILKKRILLDLITF